MLSDLKYTIKQSAVYGLSRVSIKLVAFILFPLYSVYFSVEQYGIIVRGEIFWQLFQSALFFAIETAIIRWYSLSKSETDRKSLLFTLFILLLTINLIILSVALIFTQSLSRLVFNSDNYQAIVIFCVLISLSETLIGIPLLILRIHGRALKYSLVLVTSSVISMAVQLYFIIYSDYKLEGVFLSKVLAPSLIFLILSPLLIKSLKAKFNSTLAKEVFVFCYPLMLASLVSTLLNSQDRFILGYLTDSREVGLYGLGCNIAGILTFLFISPFSLAFPIVFWKKINDENAFRFYSKSMTYSYFIFVWAALSLSLLAPHFIKVFARNPDYWLAKNIVPFIAFSLVFYGMQVIGFMSFYHDKKTNIVLLILTISTIFNLMLNILLIPVYKMYGAAISTFFSYFLSVILIYSLSKRFYFIEWENYKLALSMSIGILLTIPYYIIDFQNIIIQLSLKFITIALFPIILYVFNFYDEIEIVTIKKYLKRKTP